MRQLRYNAILGLHTYTHVCPIIYTYMYKIVNVMKTCVCVFVSLSFYVHVPSVFSLFTLPSVSYPIPSLSPLTCVPHQLSDRYSLPCLVSVPYTRYRMIPRRFVLYNEPGALHVDCAVAMGGEGEMGIGGKGEGIGGEGKGIGGEGREREEEKGR